MIDRKYLICRLCVFAAVYFPFSFSLAFCFTKIMCETLCKFLYVYASLECIFMHNIMINRKFFGNFEFFGTLAENVLSFYFFVSRFFLPSWCFRIKQKQKAKTVLLPFLPENVPFCRKQNADFQWLMDI